MKITLNCFCRSLDQSSTKEHDIKTTTDNWIQQIVLERKLIVLCMIYLFCNILNFCIFFPRSDCFVTLLLRVSVFAVHKISKTFNGTWSADVFRFENQLQKNTFITENTTGALLFILSIFQKQIFYNQALWNRLYQQERCNARAVFRSDELLRITE